MKLNYAILKWKGKTNISTIRLLKKRKMSYMYHVCTLLMRV